MYLDQKKFNGFFLEATMVHIVQVLNIKDQVNGIIVEVDHIHLDLISKKKHTPSI